LLFFVYDTTFAGDETVRTASVSASRISLRFNEDSFIEINLGFLMYPVKSCAVTVNSAGKCVCKSSELFSCPEIFNGMCPF
jgi:hypothetical protein